MLIEYRVLGPLDVMVGGASARLGAPRQRAVLAVLVLHSDRVVSVSRLVDEVWPADPPGTADNLIQGYISQLRKELGKDAIETAPPGYRLRTTGAAVDLREFERLLEDGTALVAAADHEEASRVLTQALALWRGPALADVVESGVLRLEAARLDELRLAAQERHIEAELGRGRQERVLSELQRLVHDHPLREHPRALLMLALYRAGRQADALALYRDTRRALVEELGIEPGPRLQELERMILAQDPELQLAAVEPAEDEVADRSVLVAAFVPERLDDLVELGSKLAQAAGAELLLVTTVADAGRLRDAVELVRAPRDRAVGEGVAARAAAFTSLAPGRDVVRLALEQQADLVLVDAPEGLLEDARLLTVLTDSPCDVGVVVRTRLSDGPVVVPFTGAQHDWAAVELGAWLARSRGTTLLLAGAAAQGGARDASRLLANASLAVQRGLAVEAEPILVAPDAVSLLETVADAGAAVIGLTDRWMHEGLGRTRTTLATSAPCATILVRRGLRPGGLAPRAAGTRFTWTVAPG